MSNRVDDFLAKLAANAPKEKKEFESKTNRSLEKVFLNAPVNYGRYQVFPMNSIIDESFPFVTLFGTREICIPRKYVNSDGTEKQYNLWVRILPKDAYVMKDMNGRVVSSLTALDEQILNQAYLVFDQLWDEVDARNSLDIQKMLCRRRNYTIFHAMCLNKWDPNESRNPSKQNFCALFVCTAKGFLNCIQDNIQEKTLMNGGSKEWLADIYNRQTSGRTGFLMFSVNLRKDGQAGFSVTTTHEIGNKSFENITISPEDAALMSDPIESFLGSQANRDEQNPVGQRRLFNQNLIREAIEYMSEMLASIRTAKSMNTDLKEAIKKTSDAALERQVSRQPIQRTNDPVLASMNSDNQSLGQNSVVNPESIVNNNNSPFQTPPVYHADPVTGAPVNPGTTPEGQQSWGGFGNQGQSGAGFTPNFGGFGNNQENDDLPF